MFNSPVTSRDELRKLLAEIEAETLRLSVIRGQESRVYWEESERCNRGGAAPLSELGSMITTLSLSS